MCIVGDRSLSKHLYTTLVKGCNCSFNAYVNRRSEKVHAATILASMDALREYTAIRM